MASLKATKIVRLCARLILCAAPLLIQTTASAQTPGVTVVDAARRASSLRLQPGDRIAIHVVGEPEFLRDTVMVNERGEASFAKLGVVNVGAFGAAQLADSLRARYSVFLRNPALEIVVLRRVAVNGEVKNPEVYLVDISTTLRDVIAKAGGITEAGHRGKVYIVRNGERTRVPSWESDVTTTADLQSGDQVVVGRKSWLALNALSAVYTAVVVAGLVISVAR